MNNPLALKPPPGLEVDLSPANLERLRNQREAEDQALAEAERDTARWEAIRNGIPPRFRDTDPRLLLPALRKWDTRKWVYLTGPTGTGKTTQLAALARTYYHVFGGDVAWYHSQGLFDAMRDGYRERKAYPARAHTARLVVIDDLGDEAPTRYVAQKLSQVVNDAYESGRVLVVSSNFTPVELAQRLVTPEGDASWAKRIVSRLAEQVQIVRVEGVDRRMKRNA